MTTDIDHIVNDNTETQPTKRNVTLNRILDAIALVMAGLIGFAIGLAFMLIVLEPLVTSWFSDDAAPAESPYIYDDVPITALPEGCRKCDVPSTIAPPPVTVPQHLIMVDANPASNVYEGVCVEYGSDAHIQAQTWQIVPPSTIAPPATIPGTITNVNPDLDYCD